jgi:hypothetical protein
MIRFWKRSNRWDGCNRYDRINVQREPAEFRHSYRDLPVTTWLNDRFVFTAAKHKDTINLIWHRNQADSFLNSLHACFVL